MSVEKKSFWKEWRFVIILFIITFLISFSLLLFVRFPLVHGSSMNPTYSDGDRVLMFRFNNNIDIGDIVVIKVGSKSDKDYIIKRVIAKEYDVVRINQSGCYVNNDLLTEDYVLDDNWYKYVESEAVYVIPEHSVFVMGDNRLGSKDSRMLGSFDIDDVQGVVVPDLILQ